MSEIKEKVWECGKENAGDVIATLSGTTLIFSGSGEMENYTYEEDNLKSLTAPWLQEDYINVIIENNITNIGDSAFAGCYGLNSIIIPESVTMIGSDAFIDCTGLSSITLPDNLTSIGDYAFLGSGLKSITIPQNVSVIGKGVFQFCEKLKSVTNLRHRPQNLIDYEYREGINNTPFDGDFWYENLQDYRPKKYYGSFGLTPFHIHGIILYVPASEVDNYKSAPVWEYFRKNIKPIPTPNEQLEAEISRIDEEITRLTKEKETLCIKLHEMRTLDAKNHKPKETKSFLSLFNNSEGLKYLTHKFNGEKPDYDEFIRLCKRAFDEAIEKYPNVPTSLIKYIVDFAFSKSHTGWSEPSFMEWYNQKTSTHPGLDARWNNEMIIPFKGKIEVRDENLLNIINKTIEQSFFGDSKSDFSIELDEKSLKQAHFYTAVDKFRDSLGYIFTMIRDRAEKNLCFNIAVSYEDETFHDGQFKKVIIVHKDSEATKNSNDPEFAGGDLKAITSNLWGLCNYEILAKFPDGFRKKVILSDDTNEMGKSFETDETVTGFTHVLKFY